LFQIFPSVHSNFVNDRWTLVAFYDMF